MKAATAIAILLAGLLLGAGSTPVAGHGDGEHGRSQVASCEEGPVMIGSGRASWRRESLHAGPLGVRRKPLRQMTETGSGQLVAKMPALVEGRRAVTLSVPPRLRHRVFLYYGFFEGRDGSRTTRIAGAPGFDEILFRPCTDRPRTVWPGGIRIKGRTAVRLTVRPENGSAIPLPLGRPKVLSRG